MLFNDDYSVFSGNVINHPMLSFVQQCIGALPRSAYRWSNLVSDGAHAANASALTRMRAGCGYGDGTNKFDPGHYFWLNIGCYQGSRSKESFVYNVAMGRLDVYNFPVWNFHQCRCGPSGDGTVTDTDDDKVSKDFEGQEPQGCHHGFIRWSINAVAFLRSKIAAAVPELMGGGDDELGVSVFWSSAVPPKRAGAAGESLFVHHTVSGSPIAPADCSGDAAHMDSDA